MATSVRSRTARRLVHGCRIGAACTRVIQGAPIFPHDGVDDSSASAIKKSSTSKEVRMEPSPSSLLLLGDDEPSHDSDDDSRNGYLNFDSTVLNCLHTKTQTVIPVLLSR